LPRQPQTGTSVGEATEVIKVEKETVVETVIVTATPQVFDIEAEREAVLAEYDAQVDAMAAADWAAVLEYTHKDASFFYTYSDIQGDNTRSGIDLDRPSMLWHATDQDVIVTPELAVVKSLVTMQIPPGPEAKVYHTAVYKKEDGQWYMIHSHESWRP
jgi:ketosteroid isomerase-like protein